LEEDEGLANASLSVKRAHPIVAEVKSDPKLIFRFKTCQARVWDAERKFYDAALKYLDLSQSGTELKYSELDLLQTLENAVSSSPASSSLPPSFLTAASGDPPLTLLCKLWRCCVGAVCR
jgi:COP9 signalosome complex subunit 4